MLLTFCALFSVIALGQPQPPTGGIDPQREATRIEDQRNSEALNRINTRFVELRKQYQDRSRACPTSQCRLDLNKEFRDQSAALARERTAVQEQHRQNLRGLSTERGLGVTLPRLEDVSPNLPIGRPGSGRGTVPPVDPSTAAPTSPSNADASRVLWGEWHSKFDSAVSSAYQDRKATLVREGKWFPNGLKLTVLYTVNRDGTVALDNTSPDPVPAQFKQACHDAIKSVSTSAQAAFPPQSNRNCVRKSFTFHTSSVPPPRDIEDVEALPVDSKGWCPDLSTR
jgi:hypothetical protein